MLLLKRKIKGLIKDLKCIERIQDVHLLGKFIGNRCITCIQNGNFQCSKRWHGKGDSNHYEKQTIFLWLHLEQFCISYNI